MTLISVSDFFSTALWFILAIIVFMLALPIFVIVVDICDSFLFSVFDCIIYLPKGWNGIKKAIKKEWQTMFIIKIVKKWKAKKLSK